MLGPQGPPLMMYPPWVEKSPEEVAVEQNKAQGEKTEVRVEAGASSQQQPN
jgi:hypothetical protein